MKTLPHTVDLQATAPAIPVSLTGVGVRGVRCMVPVGGGCTSLATIDASVDLDAGRKGVHMSRFHEVVTQAVGEAMAAPSCAPDLLAARVGALVAERQGATRALVTIGIELELADTTPATGRATGQPVLARGQALVDLEAQTSRRALGVTLVGMNACPCAQELVRARARERLLDAGFGEAQADLALDLIPGATHNQRGTGTLVIGSESLLDVQALAAIVRGSMSAPVHELLKRQDELAVVEHAHRHPRFVEDCVREMLAATLNALPALADGDLVWAHQRNHESIHAHDVVAERGSTVGGLRRELAGDGATEAASSRALDVASWLLH